MFVLHLGFMVFFWRWESWFPYQFFSQFGWGWSCTR